MPSNSLRAVLSMAVDTISSFLILAITWVCPEGCSIEQTFSFPVGTEQMELVTLFLSKQAVVTVIAPNTPIEE